MHNRFGCREHPDTAQEANAEASKEGERNPRESSAAQAELGTEGGTEVS